MTPETVHYGRAQALLQQRAETLNVAFLANPKRFKGKVPQPPRLPTAVWINPPKQETTTTTNPDPSTDTKFMQPGVSKSLTRSGVSRSLE